MATRRLVLALSLLLGLQAVLAVDIAKGEPRCWRGHGRVQVLAAAAATTTALAPGRWNAHGCKCRPLRWFAEYGVCPKYTVVSGDSLFGIAQKLNTTAGGSGSAAAARPPPVAAAVGCWVQPRSVLPTLLGAAPPVPHLPRLVRVTWHCVIWWCSRLSHTLCLTLQAPLCSPAAWPPPRRCLGGLHHGVQREHHHPADWRQAVPAGVPARPVQGCCTDGCAATYGCGLRWPGQARPGSPARVWGAELLRVVLTDVHDSCGMRWQPMCMHACRQAVFVRQPLPCQ